MVETFSGVSFTKWDSKFTQNIVAAKSLDLLDFLIGEKPGYHNKFKEDNIHSLEQHARLFDRFDVPYSINEHATRSFEQYQLNAARTEQALDLLNDGLSNPMQMGMLLGYPACCVERFTEKHQELGETTVNQRRFAFSASQIKNQGPFPFVTNRFIRGKGFELIGHFPCSYDCKDSVAIGKRRLSLLESYNPKLAKEIQDELSALIITHQELGTIQLMNYTRDGNTFVLDHITGNSVADQSGFTADITEAGQFSSPSCDQLHIGDNIIDDAPLRVAVFIAL